MASLPTRSTSSIVMVWRLCPILLLCGLLLGPAHAWAQEEEQEEENAQEQTAEAPPALVQRVRRAFTEGDPQALLDSAADRLEVSLFGTRTFYSRAQAFYVLRDFFRDYAPRRFELQDVSETGTSRFVIGRYWHTRGERPLRVYVRLETEDERWLLHEVRIEPVRP